ncbi:MAG: GYDIA family GHMP kinase [Saprospiraceae bacterium]|nr:GYDIA family GHMP kinase [Saprospiraceae bacterium]MDW8230153.1 GYDIA family GHMP kinase [Saprospiraceae bacterium]
MSTVIRAHGKLLLTGEYAVLDGAEALALPVRYGQTLHAQPSDTPATLRWTSVDAHGTPWFEAAFSLPTLSIESTSDPKTAERLRDLLLACRRQRADFLADLEGWNVRIEADYPLHWGLGSSSTLVAALARWAAVDPYAVLFETLGGSGYDIACAFATGPIFYQLEAHQTPHVEAAPFDPPFADHLFFVFLERKQDSHAEIRRFRQSKATPPADWLNAISALARQCAAAQTLEDFAQRLREHEQLLAPALARTPVQEALFEDFPGVVKSLGAWGGDFVLAASPLAAWQTQQYFAEKGFPTCIPFRDMAL